LYLELLVLRVIPSCLNSHSFTKGVRGTWFEFDWTKLWHKQWFQTISNDLKRLESFSSELKFVSFSFQTL
jgi:hypothetical protein